MARFLHPILLIIQDTCNVLVVLASTKLRRLSISTLNVYTFATYVSSIFYPTLICYYYFESFKTLRVRNRSWCYREPTHRQSQHCRSLQVSDFVSWVYVILHSIMALLIAHRVPIHYSQKLNPYHSIKLEVLYCTVL